MLHTSSCLDHKLFFAVLISIGDTQEGVFSVNASREQLECYLSQVYGRLPEITVEFLCGALMSTRAVINVVVLLVYLKHNNDK